MNGFYHEDYLTYIFDNINIFWLFKDEVGTNIELLYLDYEVPYDEKYLTLDYDIFCNKGGVLNVYNNKRKELYHYNLITTYVF